ncbi:leucine-rich repeat domain-containing protein, partial [Ruminococcus callidus]
MKKQWKRLAALSSAAVMAAGTLLYFPTDTLQNISWGITASAEETGTATWTQTESDNLVWTLYDNGTLTISGEGAMKNYYNNSPATQKKDNIKKVVIEDGVTSIGEFAFRDCSSLTSIEIPSSVTSIGDYAFGYCSSLASIEIPSSVTNIGNGAFSDCSSLASITIPESVTSIGNFAFCGCIRLTDITIPKSVTSIGINVFGDCTVLTEVLLENGSTLTSGQLGVDENIIKTYWNEDNLTWTLTADGTMTISGTGAMKEDYNIYYSPAYDNKNIKKVVIEDGVTSIGGYAFSGCSMTSITIPDSVTSIGGSAFEWCTGLTSIEIPEGVTSIGEFVFFGCYKLTEVFLENGSKLTSGNLGVNESIIGTYWNEGDLTWTLTADGTLTISGTGAMKDYSYDSPACDNSNIKKVVIEEDVTSIGDSAFSYCSSLTDITIPGSVTSIGNDAFSWCTSLTGITIPSSVTSIGNGAFSGCSSLTDITIPSSVTSIGESAFESCTDLTNITIPKSVTSIGSNVFDGCTALTEVLLEGGSTLTSENFGEVANKVVIRWNEDNLTWTLTADGTLAISGTGAMKEYGAGSSPAAQKKDSVKKVVIEDGITNIVDFAFFDCTVLESIEIPGSVASIGNFAFCSCIRLTDITIPGSVTSIGDYAFLNCTGLTSINIPEGVTSIGNYAFMSCDGLTSITIPKSVTSIGGNVFNGCTALTEVLLEGGSTLTSESFGKVADKVVTRWNEDNLTWTLTADGTMTISGSGAMKDYDIVDSPATQKKDNVKKVVIQEGITSIGKYAFSVCRNLASIEIPSSVTSIGNDAFSACSNSPEITVPCDSTLKKDAFGNASEKVKYRHSLVKTDAKDATYTEAGNVEYWTCENCKKHFLSDETDAEAAKEVELSATVKPVPVQVATATTQIKCVYGQDMDEIDLQDYVKNADAVGGVSVKVATGSTMLDGMQLEGSKLSGKPTKVYTNGKDVTFTFTAKNGNTANLTLHFLVAKADPTVKVTVDGDSHTEGDLVEKLGLSISKDSTKGAAKIVSKLKKLIAGKNTLAWEFTPEDSENYNVVTGTVVVNAQTTTTTTTTTTATTTTTTTTNETTSTTKETTATTKATTATSGTTSATKA